MGATSNLAPAAVRAFLTAEGILPHRVLRDPFAREVIAGLVAQHGSR